MNNNYIDITEIYIPKYIYLDEIYDYSEILLNIQHRTPITDETRKRKISEIYASCLNKKNLAIPILKF